MTDRYSSEAPLAAPQTKQHFVLQALRSHIASGEIAPGSWIRTDEWAKRLKVSQTPVREALRQLEAQGIVEIHPHVGARLKVYSAAEFEDHFRLRALLEGLAAELAVSRMGADEREELAREIEQANGRLRQLAGRADRLGEFQALNHDLHRRIVQHSRSPVLIQLLDSLRMMGHPLEAMFYLRTDPGTVDEILVDHQEIADAIRRGRGANARASAARHIRTAQRRVAKIADEVYPDGTWPGGKRVRSPRKTPVS